MKQIGLLILLFGLAFNSCNQSNQSATTTENQVEKSPSTENVNDKNEIQQLIREVLEWSDTQKSIDLLPAITDIDSVYIGFNLEIHNQNLEELKMTEFFANEFIENYDQIILTLDQKIRGNEFDEWKVGYLPTFSFANDHSPWCNCQDNLDWEKVEVKANTLTSTQGDLIWYWGNLSSDIHSSWREFEYNFRVVRDNGKWKISYLEGFDLNESIK
jgi:hypothetical protein